MSEITRRELGLIEDLLRFEGALAEKFAHYAAHVDEEATKKLCEQLADRGREHLGALIDALESRPSM